MKIKENINKAFSKLFKKPKGEKMEKDESVLLDGAKILNQVEKTVIVKINVDKDGNYFLDNNGKEVEMLDATENYIKKVTTESKKVQGILSHYMRGN